AERPEIRRRGLGRALDEPDFPCKGGEALAGIGEAAPVRIEPHDLGGPGRGERSAAVPGAAPEDEDPPARGVSRGEDVEGEERLVEVVADLGRHSAARRQPRAPAPECVQGLVEDPGHADVEDSVTGRASTSPRRPRSLTVTWPGSMPSRAFRSKVRTYQPEMARAIRPVATPGSR